MEELEYKIEKFKNSMLKELKSNSYKGNILDFKNFNEIITQLEYHKAKMLIAIRCNDKHAIKEYIADSANFLLCLGNLYNLYNDSFLDISSEASMEIRCDKDVFWCVTKPQLNQHL